MSSLQRLATALKVPIAEFFRDGARQTAVLVKRNLGYRSHSNGMVMESLGIGMDNQQLEPFRMTIGPGLGNGNDPVSHAGEEFIHCLDGEIEYSIGDRVYRLEQGDSLLFDATQQHAFRNPLPTPATILLIFHTTQDRHRVQRLHLG